MLMKIYLTWTTVVLALAFLARGASPDNLTRMLVLAFLGCTLLWQRYHPGKPHRSGREFVLDASWRALVVEFFYMFSRPVFPWLLHRPGDSGWTLLHHTLVDWAFTFPAYLLIFSVFWQILFRYEYSFTAYVVLFSAGQALGDGQAFFLAQPLMLPWIPYVMTNYQAINVIPYLRARDSLPPGRKRGSWWLPLLLLPITYFVAGASIHIVAKLLGMN